jgi:hypothetical protein
MRFAFNRAILTLSALFCLAFALAGCSDHRGEIWGVDYSKGVQLPPSDYPGPNNNPPPKS